jgi:hypothetical protein
LHLRFSKRRHEQHTDNPRKSRSIFDDFPHPTVTYQIRPRLLHPASWAPKNQAEKFEA